MKEINEQIATGFDKFLEFFSPATIDNATDFYTTAEIISAIRDIYPVEIPPDEIVRLMQKNNFDYMPEPQKFSLSLKWIIKRK